MSNQAQAERERLVTKLKSLIRKSGTGLVPIHFLNDSRIDYTFEQLADFILATKLETLERLKEAGPKNSYEDCQRCTDSVCAKHAAYLVQTGTNQLWHQAIDTEIRKVKGEHHE